MTILEWFDPCSEDHIKEYRYLQITGTWREGFIPDHIEFVPSWHIHLQSILADCYIWNMLNGRLKNENR